MKTIRRAALLGVLAIVWLVGSVSLLAAQQGAAVALPTLTPAQMEDFLLTARVSNVREVGQGVTGTQRATLSDGRITHDAHIQTVDISKALFEPTREVSFRDSYLFNIAGYRIARLLGLDCVPVSVERRVQGRLAAVTWWVDDVLMTEGERQKKQSVISTRITGQTPIMRVFDELIANTDRNAGNILWTTDGKMWLIDHTRAFRLGRNLKSPRLLERCERGLLEKMRGLTAETLKREVGNSLKENEIKALLARRDELVKLFEDLIAQRGEDAILYTLAER